MHQHISYQIAYVEGWGRHSGAKSEEFSFKKMTLMTDLFCSSATRAKNEESLANERRERRKQESKRLVVVCMLARLFGCTTHKKLLRKLAGARACINWEAATSHLAGRCSLSEKPHLRDCLLRRANKSAANKQVSKQVQRKKQATKQVPQTIPK